jgi:hypothetical protein
MLQPGITSPEPYTSENQDLAFIRFYAQDAYQAVGDLLRTEMIHDGQADEYLLELARLSQVHEIAETIASDDLKALAFAAIGRSTGDAEVIEEAFQSIENIDVWQQRDYALLHTVVELGDPSAISLITNPILRDEAMASIVINTKDQILMQFVPDSVRLHVINKMVNETGDISWFNHIADPRDRDSKLAAYAGKIGNRIVIDHITDPYTRAKALMDMRYQWDVSTQNDSEVDQSDIRAAIADIESPLQRAYMYVNYMKVSGDLTSIEELRQVAKQIPEEVAVYVHSYIARFSGDIELARDLRENVDEVYGDIRNEVRANIAVTLRDLEEAAKITYVDLRQQTITEILLAIGDCRLAIKHDDYVAASEIAKRTENVELAIEIGVRWSGDGNGGDPYDALYAIATKQKSIRPLLKLGYKILQHQLIRKYVRETGDASELGLIEDVNLLDNIQDILAVKFADTRQAESTGKVLIIAAVKQRLAAVTDLIVDLPLQAIADVENPEQRIELYEKYLFSHALPAEAMDDVVDRIVTDVRAYKPQGQRFPILQRVGEKNRSTAILKEAVQDTVFISDTEKKVRALITTLSALRHLSSPS